MCIYGIVETKARFKSLTRTLHRYYHILLVYYVTLYSSYAKVRPTVYLPCKQYHNAQCMMQNFEENCSYFKKNYFDCRILDDTVVEMGKFSYQYLSLFSKYDLHFVASPSFHSIKFYQRITRNSLFLSKIIFNFVYLELKLHKAWYWQSQTGHKTYSCDSYDSYLIWG